MHDELKFVRVEDLGSGAETFVQVPPFAVRLGNVIRGIGTAAVWIGCALAAWNLLGFAAEVMAGNLGMRKANEFLGVAFWSVVVVAVLFYLPSRVLDYLLTGRK